MVATAPDWSRQAPTMRPGVRESASTPEAEIAVGLVSVADEPPPGLGLMWRDAHEPRDRVELRDATRFEVGARVSSSSGMAEQVDGVLKPCLSDRGHARVAHRRRALRLVEGRGVDAGGVGEAAYRFDVVASARHGAALEVAEPGHGALAVDVEAAACGRRRGRRVRRRTRA